MPPRGIQHGEYVDTLASIPHLRITFHSMVYCRTGTMRVNTYEHRSWGQQTVRQGYSGAKPPRQLPASAQGGCDIMMLHTASQFRLAPDQVDLGCITPARMRPWHADPGRIAAHALV
jgi:hypothetical protein